MSNKRKPNLTRRNVLAGLGTIGVASAGAGLGTSAFFYDTESFEGMGEYYRSIGLISFLILLGAELNFPRVIQVESLLWLSGFFLRLAVSTRYQLRGQFLLYYDRIRQRT